jgi:hypothetical protein
MKSSAYLNSFLVLVLCLSPAHVRAQEISDCTQLRNKIEQLKKKMDNQPLSSTTRELYEDSLRKLYEQCSQCLEREISITTEMLKIVSNTDAASGVENRLRALTREKSEIDREKTARTSPNLTNGSSTRRDFTRTPALAETGPPALAANASDNRNTDANGVASTTAKSAAPSPTPITPVCPPNVAYDDAPAILKDIVARAAADVVSLSANPATATNAADFAIAPGPQMVLYVVFDAASPKSSELVRNLEAYHYLAETARTDKQLGAASNSDGAVSAIEKPGFAQLLGFAIEHGGITKKNDGTNLTLSTSLYSLYTLGSKDTAERYARAGILNRISAAATFAIDNKTNELANARRNNLSEWSAKVRLFGDRSTRSPAFQKFFDQKIKPLIRDRLRTLGGSINELSKKISKYDEMEDAALTPLPDLVRARMECPDYKSAGTNDQKEKIIADLILSQLRTNVYQPVSTQRIALDPADIARIEGEFLPNLKKSLDNLVLADKLLKDKIDELQKGPLGTFAYTNYRIPSGSDYSEAKFLFEQDKGFMGPLKLTGNLGLSFYNKPDPTLNQKKLRDVSAALSFEGTSRSRFTEAENQSKITYSFVGRYERLFENRRMAKRTPDIGTFQFVMEIPFFKGLSLPLSATYANATEEERKKGFRFNFGMRLDTDKLFELLRAGTNH